MPNCYEFVGRPATTRFQYDAVQSSTRRRTPRSVVKSEDNHLKQNDRKKLIATTRDLRRNFSVARWAISKHLDFVVTHNFRARTGDREFDRRLEAFVAAISSTKSFDSTGRHPRRRFMRLLEAARVVDGDIFTVRLRDGRVQAIEGDRVRNPGKPDGWVNGLRVGAGGQVTHYSVHRRRNSSFEFERIIPANRVIPYGFFDRFDQYRGVSPLASAVNEYRDVYEGFDYAKAKAKVAQLFTMALFRDSETGLHDTYPDDADNDTSDTPYKIDFSGGPQVLDLDPGDDVKSVESNTPGSETQKFWQDMIAVALKALDIPMSFYKEDYTNYFGNRAALNIYLRSVEHNREDVREFLNQWLAWRLRVAMDAGVFDAPAGFSPRQSLWRWVPTGTQWWNPLQEIKADALSVQEGFRSRQEIVTERTGQDFYDIVDQLADENTYMLERGLTPSNGVAPELSEMLNEALNDAQTD